MVETQTTSELSTYELRLIEIVRKLPSDRVVQLVDFAHFLEWQIQETDSDNGYDEKAEPVDEASPTSQAKWEQLLTKPTAKSMMRKMAREALEEYHAGHTTDITTTEDGRLAPA